MNLKLEPFLHLCEQDEALLAFAARRTITLHFQITDLKQEFILSFTGGKLIARMGAPEGKPEILVKLDSDTFHGVFNGEINPANAAIGGRLKFKGDTMKAVSLQKLIKDFVRLYKASLSAQVAP